MIASKPLALAALTCAFAMNTGEANAARVLLAELLARPPAADGAPAMSRLALEACLREAGKLDRTGYTIDTEVAAVAGFDRDCAQGFAAGDLAILKTRLGIK